MQDSSLIDESESSIGADVVTSSLLDAVHKILESNQISLRPAPGASVDFAVIAQPARSRITGFDLREG